MLITLYISITSVNLMASLGSLSAIARQRPAFMSIVVQAFESLHGKKLLFMPFRSLYFFMLQREFICIIHQPGGLYWEKIKENK